METDTKLLTTAELAEKFQVSEVTVTRWIARGCPHIKPPDGAVLRFDFAAVCDWAKRGGDAQ